MPKAVPLLLDLYPSAAVAYSLRKLRTAYSGNAIRVRRSSDNTEQNIGFVDNVLDTASLLTFVGANNGFVTTWYDQSGNARNATNATAAGQPRIVNAGVLDTLNSKPSIINPNAGVVRRLTTSLSYTQPLPVTAIFAGRINQLPTNPFGNITFQLGGSTVGVGGGGRYELFALPSSFGANIRGGSSISISPFNTIPFIQQANFRLSQLDLRLNGVDATPVAHSGTPFGTPGTFQLFGGGGIPDAQLYSNLNISEVIIYVSDKYTNRTGIESNINSFYSIY
jgi:hypothetical protein